MIKSHAVEVIATHTGVALGRIQSIAQRATEAGILPKAAGQHRPPLSHDQMARLLIAVLCDNGIGHVEQSVLTFSRLHSADLGTSLVDFIGAVIEGGSALPPGLCVRSLILRNDLSCPGASVILQGPGGSFHTVFGTTSSDAGAAKHAVLTGEALASVAEAFRAAQRDVHE